MNKKHKGLHFLCFWVLRLAKSATCVCVVNMQCIFDFIVSINSKGEEDKEMKKTQPKKKKEFIFTWNLRHPHFKRFNVQWGSSTTVVRVWQLAVEKQILCPKKKNHLKIKQIKITMYNRIN